MFPLSYSCSSPLQSCAFEFRFFLIFMSVIIFDESYVFLSFSRGTDQCSTDFVPSDRSIRYTIRVRKKKPEEIFVLFFSSILICTFRISIYMFLCNYFSFDESTCFCALPEESMRCSTDFALRSFRIDTRSEKKKPEG